MTAGLNFYLITQDGATAPVLMSTYQSKAELADAVRTYYEGSFDGDKGVSQSIWMFEGRRIRLSGDPLRVLRFPDGSTVPLRDNDLDAADETKLIPPSVRNRVLGRRPAD